MSTGRVLVTGAGGFTGRHACRLLGAAGWQVMAVGSPRNPPDFATGLAALVSERCDLTDGDAVRHLLQRERPDAVLHLAGQNAVDLSWQNPPGTISSNLMSTVNLLHGIRSEKLHCRVIVIGSMLRPPLDRLTETLHPYAFSKTLQFMASQAWYRWYGMPVMVVEPCNLIGPGGSTGICGKIASWVAAAETGGELQPFTLSSLDEKRDFLDVRDAVAAYEVLLRKGEPGGRYALESGQFRSLGELKEIFDAETNRELIWHIGASAADSPKPRDTGPIRSLGWQPSIPFRQSVQDVLEAERQRVRLKG